jgi:septum formation protein
MLIPIVLASASPRRKALLAQLGLDCIVKPVAIDESLQSADERPLDYVQRVAAEKSAACLALYDSDVAILAADTSVILNNQIMGKPENQRHSAEMLRQLSGTTHQVYSAVSLRYAGQHYQAVNITAVRFRQLTDAEIAAYWHSGEPCDKAGSYAIQGLGSVFIEKIDGSFSAVMGLPLFETVQLFKLAHLFETVDILRTTTLTKTSP